MNELPDESFDGLLYSFYAGDEWLGHAWGNGYYNDKRVFNEHGRDQFKELHYLMQKSGLPVRAVNQRDGTEILLNSKREIREWMEKHYPGYARMFSDF